MTNLAWAKMLWQTDSAVCRNAKRLTINCCHCTLSDVPVSLPCTPQHTAALRRFPVTQLWHWEHKLTPSKGHIQLHNISAPEVRGGHECTSTLFTDEQGACRVRWRIILLQEMNETIMLSSVRTTKRAGPSFVKFTCRRATTGGGVSYFKLPKLIVSCVM